MRTHPDPPCPSPKSFYQMGLRELRNLLPCPAPHSLCGKCPSSVKMELLEKKIATTHRVQEHELLKRLEHFANVQVWNFQQMHGRKMTAKRILYSVYVLLKI
jgi:hypothetical protein